MNDILIIDLPLGISTLRSRTLQPGMDEGDKFVYVKWFADECLCSEREQVLGFFLGQVTAHDNDRSASASTAQVLDEYLSTGRHGQIRDDEIRSRDSGVRECGISECVCCVREGGDIISFPLQYPGYESSHNLIVVYDHYARHTFVLPGLVVGKYHLEFDV